MVQILAKTNAVREYQLPANLDSSIRYDGPQDPMLRRPPNIFFFENFCFSVILDDLENAAENENLTEEIFWRQHAQVILSMSMSKGLLKIANSWYSRTAFAAAKIWTIKSAARTEPMTPLGSFRAAAILAAAAVTCAAGSD